MGTPLNITACLHRVRLLVFLVSLADRESAPQTPAGSAIQELLSIADMHWEGMPAKCYGIPCS
jgi:NO-binding membrane sensor protein with MHYT domain